jgi:CDP-glucose 4,6-dehydratase
MQTILVTGLNGFLGSAIAQRLLSMKKTVIGLVRDRNYKSKRDILDNISVVYGDIRDTDIVRWAVSKYEVDTIFHLGAITILRMATVDPLTCYQVNVMGTLNVLEAARACKHVKKVVVASSDKAYGNHDVLPYVENYALLASDPYSTSKSCMDLMSQSYAYTYGLDVSIVRSGNIFGPGDLNRSRLIPGAILGILDGRTPVIYKGVGVYKREFMFIDDVVDAYLCVQDRGLKGEAYNIGGSGWQTIIAAIEVLIEEMGIVMEPEIVEKDFIEIKEQYLDSSKLQNLGWKCKHDIRSGLRATIPWYREWHKDPTKFYYAA